MLPTMQPVEKSRTQRARATKAFEEVRVGRVRLYFSHFELIGFQVDGSPPAVCLPLAPIGVGTSAHVLQHRSHLEPDKSKWCSKQDFEKKWLEVSGAAFQAAH
jgi:hypothetical protein